METPYSSKFGKRLEELLPHSKQQVAEELGCSGVTVRFWVKGKIPFAIHLLRRMRKKYGIDLNELIAGEEDNDVVSD